jgi:hypothetical protein
MSQTITVIYDGQVLRPETTVDLEINARYRVTLEELVPPAQAGNAWDVLESMTGCVEGPVDWAAEHDHYLYGTAKRKPEHP